MTKIVGDSVSSPAVVRLIRKLGLLPDPSTPGAFRAPELTKRAAVNPDAQALWADRPYRPVDGRDGFTLYE